MMALSKKQRNMVLDTIGITSWRRRSQNKTLLSYNINSFASCFILLPEKPPEKGEAAYQVFQGMLKVLTLSADELCIGWINPAAAVNSVYTDICSELNEIFPKMVLIMGKKWASGFVLAEGEEEPFLKSLSCSVHITYHPQELVLAPQNKRQAYQDLLRLKEEIHQKRRCVES